MPDIPALWTILENAGVAGIIVILFITGWIVPKSHLDEKEKECERWRKMAEDERKRADIYQQTAMTNTEVLKALQSVAVVNRRMVWDDSIPPPPYSHPAELSGGEGANTQ
jgi:hypothetical protein